jgi:hypothetical protein
MLRIMLVLMLRKFALAFQTDVSCGVTPSYGTDSTECWSNEKRKGGNKTKAINTVVT